MARNLMEAGYDLVLFNRTRGKAEELAKDNPADVADTIEELAQKCDVVITMLPGPPEVESVCAGEGGLLDGMRQGTLLVDMSTSSPVLARGLARERSAWDRDARRAGLGRRRGGREGTLSIMAGGEEEDFEGPSLSSRPWARR